MAGNTSFELETDQENELGQIVVVQKVSTELSRDSVSPSTKI